VEWSFSMTLEGRGRTGKVQALANMTVTASSIDEDEKDVNGDWQCLLCRNEVMAASSEWRGGSDEAVSGEDDS